MTEAGRSYTLENELLKLTLNSLGAQLCSVTSADRDYLWNGDSKYWGWHSPILFPFVGRLKNDEYIYEGKKYPMTQHGFAREMLFALEKASPVNKYISEDFQASLEGISGKEQINHEIWFSLSWNEETLIRYPFHFVLHIGYRLEGNTVTVMWRVENRGNDKDMYFAIGGHPGFFCPLNEGEDPLQYLLEFDRQEIEYYSLNEKGLFLKESHSLPLTDGRYTLKENTFDQDALVIEPHKVRRISLCTPDKKPYVTMEFNSPSVGIYSQEKMRAPYLCIEPWYGRCDNADFNGELKDREHIQCLKAGEEFRAAYKMRFY